MEIGFMYCVLVEGLSKKNFDEWMGKMDILKWVVFEKNDVIGKYVGDEDASTSGSYGVKFGDYVVVCVIGCSMGMLFG